MAKTTPTNQHPRNMLEARNAAAAVLEALGPNVMRCVDTDLATFARLSDLSRGPRHRSKRNDIEDQLSKLPCDPLALRPILERIMPARLRVEQRRWSTCKSSMARVLELVGRIDGSEVLDIACTPDWEALFECISGEVHRHVFHRFGRFCCRFIIQPHEVTEDTLERYRQWLLARTLKLKVGQRINSVRMIWNKHARENPPWPQRTLSPPPRYSGRFQTDALNPAYIKSVDDYIAKLRHRDPLDPLFPKLITPPTLKQKREVLIRAGCTLIAEGRHPDTISHISRVTTPEAVRLVLLDLYNRLGQGRQWPPSAVYTARHLLEAASYVHAVGPTSLSDCDLTTVRAYCKLVRLSNAHLLPKRVRERLAVLEDPDTEERFLRIPDEAFDEADRLLAEERPSQAAHLHQAALGLAFEIFKPLRRGMLSKLDTQRHFLRDSRGRVIGLRIPAEEVEKSMVDIEAAIPRQISQQIARHERIYIPIITDGTPTTALFPNLQGKSLHRNQLAQSIVRLVRDKLGIQFNIQLVRHWATDVILDEDPRNGAIAQHVLGHRNPASKRRYGAARTRSAHRHYANLLDRKIDMLRRRRKK
jgi:hypothetical protein